MRMKRSSTAIVVALGLAVAGGSAFTASNTTTPLTSAGFEATTATGFAVSDVQYELGANAAAPADVDKGDNLDAVQFTLTPSATNLPAKQVRVRLVKAGLYYTCNVVGTPAAVVSTPTTWNCPTAGLEVLTVDALDIVAVSQADIA